mgnify:CR=1 FL=1
MKHLSILIKPNCYLNKVNQLSFLTSVSLGELFYNLSKKVKINYKWPNDILLNKKNNFIKILKSAREKRLPIIYTTNPRREDFFDLGNPTFKSHRQKDQVDVQGHMGNDIVKEIAPEVSDLFIEKRKPSAFFGTPLMSHLNMMKADSLIIVGSTTSGCVRASAVDALSYDIKVTIPHEAVFDRGEASHKLALFDLHMKYVDVTDLDEVSEYLKNLTPGLFDETFPPSAQALKDSK